MGRKSPDFQIHSGILAMVAVYTWKGQAIVCVSVAESVYRYLPNLRVSEPAAVYLCYSVCIV